MSDNDDLCRHAIAVTDVTRAVSGLDHSAVERSLRFSLIARVGKKRGLLIGMGMTEKQGGSDVMSNTTRAERPEDGSYRLVGHKWFFSVPQSDAHLVLAQTTGGLSCFFVPRFFA